ncbi:MAG: copper resistance system multicopper oxidase [Longimicrobiales bacterium]
MAGQTLLPGLDRVSRRDFLRYAGATGAVASLERLAPEYAGPYRARGQAGELHVLDGRDGPIEIEIAETPIDVGGRSGGAITMNGTVPGPLIRLREGGDAVIHVTNRLDEDTSIHWHGILLPNAMDGVPKVNFPGIRPGETFTYRYPVEQSGTYWYHSHSRLQEQLGHYGPMVIDPAEPEVYEYDRDYVVVLSDWTFESPYRVMARLKKHPHYYNFQQRTIGDFFRDVGRKGLGWTIRNRLEWGRMRMSPADISDVTGATYTYLMNGLAPGTNWAGLFEPGETVRLRFVNASAATFFDVRVPGLPLEVIERDGQPVEPVETDEFRIGIAETYDVLVRPRGKAHTVFAEAIDRSGYARGTLAIREGLEAPVPERRERPLLTMAAMGMHGDMDDEGMDDEGMDADEMTMEEDVATGGHQPPGALPAAEMHGPDGHGPGEAGLPMETAPRLDEPGLGLGDDGWRVLTYSQLRARDPYPDLGPPDREIELHLTGNMERFMWSINGVKFSDAEPIEVTYGERIRLVLVNDTMMNHPMHLHGMWMHLENGAGERMPRVHTISVKPAERISLLFNGDAMGPWAFHCHVLYHMEAGMFRVVRVSEPAMAEEE